jgi:hypothetical protein
MLKLSLTHRYLHTNTQPYSWRFQSHGVGSPVFAHWKLDVLRDEFNAKAHSDSSQ